MLKKKKYLILAPLLKTASKELVKLQEKVSNSTDISAHRNVEETKAILIDKAITPISNGKKASKFSISEALTEEEKENKTAVVVSDEDLPNQHFTETDLQREWNLFLQSLKRKDVLVYNAINGFRLRKIDEDTINIQYASDTAKSEFDKVQSDFFNHFKHKVNHFRMKITYSMDVALKKEIMTKKKLFDKMAEKNPLLNQLNEIFKFDFSA